MIIDFHFHMEIPMKIPWKSIFAPAFRLVFFNGILPNTGISIRNEKLPAEMGLSIKLEASDIFWSKYGRILKR